MYIIALNNLDYYEDKYFISLSVHFKHTVEIYSHNFTYFFKNKHK